MLLLHDLHREQFTRTELARDEDDLAELALADDTMHLKVGERRHSWWRLRHVWRGLCASHISVSVLAVAAGRKWTGDDGVAASARVDIGERRWLDLAFNGKTSVILLGPSSRRGVPSPFNTDHARITLTSQKSYSCKQKRGLSKCRCTHRMTHGVWRTHLSRIAAHRPKQHTHHHHHHIITHQHITQNFIRRRTRPPRSTAVGSAGVSRVAMSSTGPSLCEHTRERRGEKRRRATKGRWCATKESLLSRVALTGGSTTTSTWTHCCCTRLPLPHAGCCSSRSRSPTASRAPSCCSRWSRAATASARAATTRPEI